MVLKRKCIIVIIMLSNTASRNLVLITIQKVICIVNLPDKIGNSMAVLETYINECTKRTYEKE